MKIDNYILKFGSILILMFLLVFCKSSPTSPDSQPGDTVKNPKSGDWSAVTDFGGLEFTVSADSKYISKVKYTFSNWNGRSGSISLSSNPGWAITERKFEIKNDLDPDAFKKEEWIIKGTFANSGETASGTWSVVLNGTNHSGTWNGKPKG